jgi:acetamidase/formamidase
MSILTEWAGMTSIDAGFFLSAACDLRISQFLPNFSIHCRLEIPKQPLIEAGLLARLLAEPLPTPPVRGTPLW